MKPSSSPDRSRGINHSTIAIGLIGVIIGYMAGYRHCLTTKQQYRPPAPTVPHRPIPRHQEPVVVPRNQVQLASFGPATATIDAHIQSSAQSLLAATTTTAPGITIAPDQTAVTFNYLVPSDSTAIVRAQIFAAVDGCKTELPHRFDGTVTHEETDNNDGSTNITTTIGMNSPMIDRLFERLDKTRKEKAAAESND